MDQTPNLQSGTTTRRSARWSPMQLEMLRVRGSSDGAERPYQAQWAVTLERRVDRERLERAWSRLWRRHAGILRRMPDGGTDPVPEGEAPPIRFVGDAPDVEAGIEAAWRAGAGSGYRRASMELTVVEPSGGGGGDTVVLTKHHVYADGGGTSVFVREVLAPALGVGELDLSHEQPAPDFDRYLDWLDREAQDPAHEAFWRARFEGADVGMGIDFLAPPGGHHSAPAAPIGGFGSVERTLDARRTAALRATLDELGARPSTASHAVAGLVLASGSGGADAVFGSVRAMRDVPVEGARAMLGNLVTSLCVRVAADPGRTVGELLRETRANDRAARAHAGIALHDLQRIVRGATGRPFEALVVHNDGTRLENARRELGAAALAVDVRQDPSSPLVFVVGFGETVELEVKWDRARVSDARAERLANRFLHILAALAGDPERRVRELPVACDDELAAALAAGDGGPSLCAPMRLDDGFRATLAHAPDTTAVETLDARLTYREVDRRARMLAHALRAAGARADAPVALCMGRDLLLAPAQLAAWYAGSYFVPIDPELPPDRARMLVEESRAAVVVGCVEDCAALDGLAVACVDPALVGPELADAEIARGASADIAYAFFTSGSTGRPRLTLLTHQGVASYLYGIRRHYRLPDRVSTLGATPVGFDPSIIEVHLALLTGGTVGLLPRGAHLDFDRMTRTIEAVGASFATFVPAVLERLLDGVAGDAASWPRERLATLRAVVSGGEALPANVPASFRTAFGAASRIELFNAYGPTETSIGVTGIPIRAGDQPPYPIGTPVAGVRLRVVDAVGRTLPIGSFGELAISGIQVGRGYAGDPAKTAERFRDLGDPDGASYLAGDLATIDEQGVVRFFGRMDFQFKVRGVRIEAEEVERAMCEVAGVQSAVVWYRGDGAARKVIGYYRAAEGAAGGIESRLRAHLKEVLPAQVVPAAFVQVDAWPLSANGKVDRRRLVPPVDLGSADAPDLHPPPAATLAERQLRGRVAEIFAEILKSRDVRMTSSFLDLGGDSLGAVVLLDRLAREFGLAPGIADFLRDPTPVAIARRLLEGGATVRVEPVVAIHPSTARETLHCLPGVGGLAAFTYLPIAGEVAGEFRCLGYQLPGAGDGETPMRSFRAMASLLADRIVAQTPEGEIHLMGYSFGGHLAVEIATMLAARGRSVATLVVLDAAPPRLFDRARMALRHLAQSLGRDRSSGRLTRPEKLAGFRTVRGEDLGEVERRLRAVTRLSQVALAMHVPAAIPCALDLVTSNGGDIGVAGFREHVLRAWRPYARNGLRIESSDAGHVALVRYAGVPAIARVLRRSLAELAERRAAR